MKIDLIEDIKGNYNKNCNVVSGQDGMNCAVSFVDDFKINDTLILFLIPDFYGREDTLELSDCSLSYLNFSNNMVFGNITDSDYIMEYLEFKSEIPKIYLSSVKPIDESYPSINIIPNPSSGFFEVSVENFNNGIYQIYVYNMIGKIILQREIVISNEKIKEIYINIENMGSYIVNISNSSLSLIDKVFVL